MKRKFLFLSVATLLLSVISSTVAFSQSEAVSTVGSLNIVKEVKPPILQLQGDVVFKDASGDMVIDANEKCSLTIKVKNVGMGDGYGLKAVIKTKNYAHGITLQDANLPVIKVGQTMDVTFPITSDMNTKDGIAEFVLSIEEPNGFNLPDVPVNITTRAFLSPMVEFRGHSVNPSVSSLAKMEPYSLQVLVQNTGQGKAENVNVDISLPEGVLEVGQENAITNGTLESGQTQQIIYKFIIAQTYSSTQLPIAVKIREKYGKYNKDGKIVFDVLQGEHSSGTTIVARQTTTPKTIVPVSLGSDVDIDIPKTTEKNSSLRVMIIANQNYIDEQQVSTALNDGQMMKAYCVKTLGVPESNISFLENRTKAQMEGDIESFAKTIKYNNKDKFLFFYFGHGMRATDVEDAYLLPVDGSSQNLKRTGISRQRMMQQFSKEKPVQMVVYLESCFSGAASGSSNNSENKDEMLAYAENSSGVRLSDDVPTDFTGNIILITASSEAQTANAYNSQRHNVFTYEFLKALKSNKGNVDWGTMFSTVQKNTERTAWNKIRREQTPSITVSTTLGDNWKSWSVK